jgi:hypothetical protein
MWLPAATSLLIMLSSFGSMPDQSKRLVDDPMTHEFCTPIAIKAISRTEIPGKCLFIKLIVGGGAQNDSTVPLLTHFLP